MNNKEREFFGKKKETEQNKKKNLLSQELALVFKSLLRNSMPWQNFLSIQCLLGGREGGRERKKHV